MAAIEVFKTDVMEESDARQLQVIIQRRFPDYQVNFDLSDCDRILRVVSPVGAVDISTLTALAVKLNIHIALLPDEIPV